MKALVEMLTDPTTLRFSESKLWIHPAKAALVFAFLWATVKYPPSEWAWMTFGLLMFGHETASRIVSKSIASSQAAQAAPKEEKAE